MARSRGQGDARGAPRRDGPGGAGAGPSRKPRAGAKRASGQQSDSKRPAVKTGAAKRAPKKGTVPLQYTSNPMGLTVSYSHARNHLAEIWDEVEDNREAAVIRRRGHEDMALIPADELASLRETAYLLRFPANAARLLAALHRARRGGTPPTDLDALRTELGLEAGR